MPTGDDTQYPDGFGSVPQSADPYAAASPVVANAPYDTANQGTYMYPVTPVQTDGVSIAALVTGILGTGPLALILGIVGINRTKDGQRNGRGMAIAGLILGILTTIGWAIAVVLIVVALTVAADSDLVSDATMEQLATQCEEGSMASCDTLSFIAPSGSTYEEIGNTCGYRAFDGESCRGVQDLVDSE